jgi:3-dehydroquinate synthetase
MSAETAQRVRDTVRRLVRLDFPWPTAEQVWPILVHDKKKQGGKVIFVLLKEAGAPVIVADVTPAELDRAIVRAQPAKRGSVI